MKEPVVRPAGINSAYTQIHPYASGAECLSAAFERARNTTIVIGVDMHDGTLDIDFDVQADVFPTIGDLRRELALILECLDGMSVMP